MVIVVLIKIEIKGTLKNYISQGELYLKVNENINVKDLAKKIGLPEHIPKVAIINQEIVSPDYILKEKDEVIFVPIVGGG